MGVDVLYDNLGILSLPPQYSSTQDVGNAGYPDAGSPNFLANGGLPPGTGGLADLPTQIARITSNKQPALMFRTRSCLIPSSGTLVSSTCSPRTTRQKFVM